MSKILITGGNGFIGSHIARHLLGQGHTVISVDNRSNALPENHVTGVKHYKIDITDKHLLDVFRIEKPDYVSHHAAQIFVHHSVKDPINDATTNIVGTINVLECCRKTNVKKFVFASSGGAIYGETNRIPTSEDHPLSPQSPYGISKLSGEFYVQYYQRQHALPSVILRYANVYGPGQRTDAEGGVIAIFIKALYKNKMVVVYGNGEQTRDFIFVRDIAAINEKILLSNIQGIYNVGTGKQVSVNTLIKKLKKIAKKENIKITYAKKREAEVEKSALDAKKLQQHLSYQLTSLEKGLRATVASYQNKS